MITIESIDSISRDDLDTICKWLEEEFLKYIDDWESAVMQLEQLPSAERRKMCLSEETIEGLRITGTGIIIPI